MKKLKIGTRGSALALKQAEMTESALAVAFPGLEVERVIITTTGDRRTDVALSEVAKVEGVWDKGVFIKELEIALETGEIDVAVHSLKDLPTVLEEEFVLAGVLERAPVRDAFIGKISWNDLGEGSLVGTSSARRAQQLIDLKPGLEVCDLRGNVPTRLRKLAESETMDGIMLAEAGLRRLGYSVGNVLEIEGVALQVHCLPEKERWDLRSGPMIRRVATLFRHSIIKKPGIGSRRSAGSSNCFRQAAIRRWEFGVRFPKALSRWVLASIRRRVESQRGPKFPHHWLKRLSYFFKNCHDQKRNLLPGGRGPGRCWVGHAEGEGLHREMRRPGL